MLVAIGGASSWSSSHRVEVPARAAVSRHREGRRRAASNLSSPAGAIHGTPTSNPASSGADLNESSAEPSIRGDAAGCSVSARRPRAAFCLTGQPRTFVHPQAHESIHRAIRRFGADAYTFFVLTDDDGGGSYGHTPLKAQSDRVVRAAMQTLRPKEAAYGALERPSGEEPIDERRRSCRLPVEGPRYGAKTFSTTFW